MIEWIKRLFRSEERDIQRFFESLSPSKPGRQGYTKKDRYRDFKRVFATDEGRRVLSQIIDEAEGVPIVENEVSDTHRVSYRLGRRSLGLWIVRVLNAEPLDENYTTER